MTSQGLTLVDVDGPPLESGRAYGESARGAVRDSVERLRERAGRATGLGWPEICERARAWEAPIRDYYPDALVEMAGIADGAGLSRDDVLVLNARAEILWAAAGGGTGDARDDDGCTSFALLPEATSDGHVYCGQNWDMLPEISESLVVLRVSQPGRPTIVMQVEAGQIGRQGASSAGLALNANGLGGLDGFTRVVGVPATVVRRKALAGWGMNDALDAVFRVQQGYVTNILLTHADGVVVDVETTPGRHGWMYPEDGVLVHGNHFMSFVPEQLAATYRPYLCDSLYRVPRLRTALERCRDGDGPVAARIAAGLRDHFGHPDSVCDHVNPAREPALRYETVASSIVDLTTGDYRIAAGPPCLHEHELLPWNLYDGPASADDTGPPGGTRRRRPGGID